MKFQWTFNLNLNSDCYKSVLTLHSLSIALQQYTLSFISYFSEKQYTKFKDHSIIFLLTLTAIRATKRENY